MKFFEKNIKDRFKNASSLDGIDPDDLWKSIESSIPTESPKRKFIFFRKRYLLLLITLFLVGGAIVWNYGENESISESGKNDSKKITKILTKKEKIVENKNVNQIKNVTENLTKEEKLENSDNSTLAISPNIKNKNQSTTTIIENEFLNTTPKNRNSISTEIPNSNSANDDTHENKIQYTTTTTKNNFLNTIQKNSNSISDKIQNTDFAKAEIDKNNIQNSTSLSQQKALLDEQLFDGQNIDLTKIESTNLLLSIEDEDQLDLNELITLSNFKERKIKFSLGIFTGVHTLKNKFATKLTSEKERRDFLNQGFQNELGHSFAIEASVHFNQNIFITSGLEYLRSKSEFNFARTWDTIIVNPNSPVGILTDASATRTVRHHNKMEYFSIPILLGFKKSYKQIEIGVSTGVGLNFTKNQTGKSLNFNDQVTFYPVSDNDLLPVSTFFMSYHLRPYLNYALDEKISFQLRTDFRYQNFGESDFYQLKYSSIFWGLSGGVQYKF